MKDVRGKDIHVGDHIVYIRSVKIKDFNEAVVVVSTEKYIQIEYLHDMGTTVGLEKKPRRGKITATDRKVIVLGGMPDYVNITEIFEKEKNRIEKERDNVKKALVRTLKEKEELIQRNKDLQKQVDRIHNRWDILDIR